MSRQSVPGSGNNPEIPGSRLWKRELWKGSLGKTAGRKAGVREAALLELPGIFRTRLFLCVRREATGGFKAEKQHNLT